MSHISLVKIKICNPNMGLLKKTVEELAQELNGEVVSSIKDFYGNTIKDFDFAIKTSTMHRGIGIKVDSKGNVNLIGDFYGYEKAVQEFQLLLVQRYTVNALQVSLKQMGYQVQHQKHQEKIVVRAVSL